MDPLSSTNAGRLTPGRGMIHHPLSVLITGSSGFICRHLVRHLRAAGYRVTALDHLPPKFP